EDQFGVGRDLRERALPAVAQRGGDPELALAAGQHAGHPLVPARNDLPDAELEGEGLAAPAAVELRAVRPPARLVDVVQVGAPGAGGAWRRRPPTPAARRHSR